MYDGKMTVTSDGYAILPDGVDINPATQNTAQQLQMAQLLEYFSSDQAKMLLMSPAVLGDMKRGSYRSIEAALIAVKTLSISPILDKIEREVELKMLPVGWRMEIDPRPLLRGNPVAEAQIATMLKTAGIYSRNQALVCGRGISRQETRKTTRLA